MVKRVILTLASSEAAAAWCLHVIGGWKE